MVPTAASLWWQHLSSQLRKLRQEQSRCPPASTGTPQRAPHLTVFQQLEHFPADTLLPPLLPVCWSKVQGSSCMDGSRAWSDTRAARCLVMSTKQPGRSTYREQLSAAPRLPGTPAGFAARLTRRSLRLADADRDVYLSAQLVQMDGIPLPVSQKPQRKERRFVEKKKRCIELKKATGSKKKSKHPNLPFPYKALLPHHCVPAGRDTDTSSYLSQAVSKVTAAVMRGWGRGGIWGCCKQW